MVCKRLQLSWGIGFLDREYPKIETGETILIRGRRSSNEILINHMICEELSKRQPVFWIDGGMRLDPSLLIPTLQKKHGKITNLDYLYASRGFTAHQMLEIIKRLAREEENEKRLHSGKLIIISDLVNMFMDEQVSSSEGKSMLKKSLSYIKEIAPLIQDIIDQVNKLQPSKAPKNLGMIIEKEKEQIYDEKEVFSTGLVKKSYLKKSPIFRFWGLSFLMVVGHIDPRKL